MLQQQFINTLGNPHLLTDSQITELDAIVNEYPFFETAHLLYAKGLQKQNSLQFAKQLRKTAIIANSRIVLHELLQLKVTEKKNEVIPNVEEKENVIEEKVELQKIEEVKPILSNTTTTLTEVKVIYVNTIIAEPQFKPEVVAAPVETIKTTDIEKNSTQKNNEIEVLQQIENETEPKEFDIDKLNINIEQEISRGVIQSYIESDILKTPDLNKIESKEPVSFTDWLHKIKRESHTIQKIEENKEPELLKTEKKAEEITQKSPNFNQNRQLIDKIIESDPGKLKLGTNKFFTPNLDAKQSLLENEHLVTETLAKIYALQGNVNKAIRAYEILSLKFPQKSVYFATLIQNLKNNK